MAPQMTSSKNALVTGASRGIGKQLVAELLEKGYTVIAALRNLESAAGNLAKLQAGGRLHVTALDVGSSTSIAAFVDKLKQQEITHLDLVFNNAGVIEELKPFEQVAEQDFRDTYQTNTIGPFLLTQRLKLAGLIGQPGTLVVNVSSILGSCGTKVFNDYPGYAYRASKAALNIVTKFVDHALAKEGVTCVAMHPGYVKTDINGGGGDISVEESAQGMLAVLESGRELHGRFYAWDGSELPW